MRLRRAERRTTRVLVWLRDGSLTIQAGNSTESIPASGSWPGVVAVPIRWIAALTKSPLNREVIPLSLRDGKMFARSFGVSYELIERKPSVTRQGSLPF